MSEKNKPNIDASANAAKNMQIVVFKLGQEEYGLSIEQIKEVVLTPNITRMPQTPPFMKGVANIRGNVIAMLDLEEKFGLVNNTEEKPAGNKYTLVIESDEYKMGILVREVPNTLNISSANMEGSIFTGDHIDQSYITGIVKLDKRLVIMIDIFKVISEQEASQLFSRNEVEA